ncbi:hypothetical protein [Treponema parvum]|uniref:hypothetical protein n=1 Tax=Treponema parvum TaxID=138851 RepID=UPI001AEBFD4A|nr:hypothetical protein [Treponema parvum]QTQ16595.1 hypothetical protein HXT04_07775 [Treponema parvum]
MSTSGVYIHSVSSLNSPGQRSELREGSLVFVRVLSADSDGRYTVSFGGSKFSVHARSPLIPGSSFQAKITLQNGNVALIPHGSVLPDAFILKKILSDNSSSALQSISDPVLVEYFLSLGLVPDTLSLRLFQQLRELGLRFDARLLSKARSAALRFSGEETAAAEAALLLEKNGMESSDKAIKAVLSGGREFGESSGSGQSFGGKSDGEGSRKFGKPDGSEADASGGADETNTSGEAIGRGSGEADEAGETAADFKSLFFDDASFAYGNGRKCGELTLFNHLAEKNSSGAHWIVLPFDFSFSEKKMLGSGTLRLCLDLSKKNVKKMVVSANTHGQEYTFVVYYNNKAGGLKKVLFSIEPPPSSGFDRVRDALKLFLSSNGNSVEVERIQGEATPFFTDNLPVDFVRGLI